MPVTVSLLPLRKCGHVGGRVALNVTWLARYGLQWSATLIIVILIMSLGTRVHFSDALVATTFVCSVTIRSRSLNCLRASFPKLDRSMSGNANPS